MAYRLAHILAMAGSFASVANSMPQANSVSQPQANNGTITARDAVPKDKVIATILWFESLDCDATQGAVTFFDVGTLASDVFNPDQCNPGLPPFTDTANGNKPDTLPYRPLSFSVGETPATCNEDVDSGQQLGSVTLYPSCRRSVNDPTNDPSLYCAGTCEQIGWSRTEDGYNTCINVPEMEDSGPLAYSIRQRIAFC